ncbi:putative sulfate exporter family transporter [Bdellovibrio sp. 22V]|uniref:YeiH family protein n=1 Tax=Bdellovibrio TaxID=958 RepID=UPI002543F25D|nr:putative sulfate exporter family transporter [Bdellovibrio sp. 22V]WII72128.1 putative sulfate exporter family transporter [Bdellovibrio sp. 22V]
MLSGVALLSGIIAALVFGNPWMEQTRKWTSTLLSIAVVGLGAGMDLHVVGKVGLHGFGYTLTGIAFALIVGMLLGKFLRTGKDTSLLLAVGTAICGGSAIAAVAPVMRAKTHEVSVALGTVFLLNALALFVFPAVGHALHLTESQFGLWSALAIHDTSSVVGATMQYGSEALRIGTTVKLARALWIVPVAFVIGYLYSRNNGSESQKVQGKKPWFILGFIIVAAIVTWFPSLRVWGDMVEKGARYLMILTLFLIGSSLSKETLRSVGVKPLLQGALLWFLVAGGTLSAIVAGWIY